VRLRIGVILGLLSWVPFAILVGATGSARLVIWTVQVIVGLIGLAIAGNVFAVTVHSVGWRDAPSMVWKSLIHGDPYGSGARGRPEGRVNAGRMHEWHLPSARLSD
jgi:hypothetical protein